MKNVIGPVLLLTALAAGQYWEFEQVDSAGWGAWVEMRWHPDGRLFLCYTDTSGTRVRLASKDTAWHYDSLLVSPSSYVPSFRVSRQGGLGVSVFSGTYPGQLILAENRGGSWEYDSTGLWTTGRWLVASILAYDTAGNPSVVYSGDVSQGSSVIRARRVDTLWQEDTVVVQEGWHPSCFCSEYLIDRRDSAVLLYTFSDDFPDGDLRRPWYYMSLYEAREVRDTWVFVEKASHWYGSVSATAMALDTFGSPQVCWWDSLFRYEGAVIDQSAYAARIIVDSLNRPCVAYTRPDLVFTYLRGGQWRSMAVSSATTTGSSVSIVLGDDGQPLIAFSTSDGLWLARGVDVTGTEENPAPQVPNDKLAATVIRSLPAGAVAFDAMGRRVLDPKPGVYFVRGEGRGVGDAGRTRKVILQ